MDVAHLVDVDSAEQFVQVMNTVANRVSVTMSVPLRPDRCMSGDCRLGQRTHRRVELKLVAALPDVIEQFVDFGTARVC